MDTVILALSLALFALVSLAAIEYFDIREMKHQLAGERRLREKAEKTKEEYERRCWETSEAIYSLQKRERVLTEENTRLKKQIESSELLLKKAAV